MALTSMRSLENNDSYDDPCGKSNITKKKKKKKKSLQKYEQRITVGQTSMEQIKYVK
jgi:hypothetical protein